MLQEGNNIDCSVSLFVNFSLYKAVGAAAAGAAIAAV